MSDDGLDKLQKILKINFKNPNFLKQAFYHRSYLNEVKQNIESNERLEFLGDSILSLIISNYLFTNRLTDAEVELTNLRAYIVKTKSLAQAAKNLNLGEYLHLSKYQALNSSKTLTFKACLEKM